MVHLRRNPRKELPETTIFGEALSPAIQKLLSKLEEKGETENALYNTWQQATCSEEHTAQFFYFLEYLIRQSYLYYTVFLNDLSLATLFPFYNHPLNLKKIDTTGKFRLSRFCLIRMKDKNLILESPLTTGEMRIENPLVLELIYKLTEEKTLPALTSELPRLPQETLISLLTLLYSASYLDSENESTSLATWEFHDLFFHTRSRIGRHANRLGKTFRFLGKIPPSPPLRLPHVDSIPLSKPDYTSISPSFRQVLDTRKSIRKHGKDPITLRQLGEFLFSAARVKELKKGEHYDIATRPFPGGGGCYELELYPVIYNCKDIEAGMYRYDPHMHALSLCAKWSIQVELLLKDAQNSANTSEMPQVLIIIAARFARVTWKYQSMAYATILKNVGVLMQTFYLTATAMDLAPSALGVGNADLFSKLTGTDYYEESSVGEFILGSK